MMDAKLKHLEFIQTVIGRMATNSFLFKGWTITLSAALAGFAAVDSKPGLLLIALVSTLMFWLLDAYYLWLERCFIRLYSQVAQQPECTIDFAMTPDKTDARRSLFQAWKRPHLLLFYGAIILVEVVAIFVIRST